MRLIGAVETAKINNFGQLEVVVRDKEVEKPAGGRPQYNCRIVRGWPGLEDVRAAKKNNPEQDELYQFAQQAIPLPPEDTMLQLVVVDLIGKQGYKTLVCAVDGADQS